MANIRLRHPQGVSVIQVDLEKATVLELQQLIRGVTSILPSEQDVKAGYPPKSLVLVPELPVSSLDLKANDQLIVNKSMGTTSSSAAPRPSTSTPLSRASTLPPPTQTSRKPTSNLAGPVLSGLGRHATAPSPITSAPRTQVEKEVIGEDYVETPSGVLVHRVVPDNNSCLFSSIALVFKQDMNQAPQMRQIAADAIKADSEKWSEAILGHPRDKYISIILKPTTWGGAIELSIFANHFSTQISSIDVETGRVDTFTPSDAVPDSQCIVIYSGIHYDAASLAPMKDAPVEWHQTLFSIKGAEDEVIRAAKTLASKLRAKRKFTNTATFDLKCEVCKVGLKGEKEARAHAEQTGHTEFGEY